ncbi:MAG: hypothetical protein HY461_00445 [Parcubacteria group bacterium]|nr:hypothetical protein [Parcubacteria group bacterium]
MDGEAYTAEFWIKNGHPRKGTKCFFCGKPAVAVAVVVIEALVKGEDTEVSTRGTAARKIRKAIAERMGEAICDGPPGKHLCHREWATRRFKKEEVIYIDS